MLTTDVCVPISRLAECIVATRADLDTLSFPATIVGHVGDGNFHVQCMLGPDQAAEAEAFAARLVDRALAMGGTCTGEHGVGLGKKKYLKAEHGEALDVMRDSQAHPRPRQPHESRQDLRPRLSRPPRFPRRGLTLDVRCKGPHIIWNDLQFLHWNRPGRNPHAGRGS